jgi:hypothetical protein
MTCLRRSNKASLDCFLASSLSIHLRLLKRQIVRYYFCRVNSCVRVRKLQQLSSHTVLGAFIA